MLIQLRSEKRTFLCCLQGNAAIEAIEEQQTTSELKQKYKLHPNQINQWKKFLFKASTVFDKGKAHLNELEAMKKTQNELYREIGQLKMKRDGLIKKLF